jgi:hypothetical protein
MQIGCCWFDNARRLLTDQSTATPWHLNDNEFWVINQLVQHRGQVVPLSVLATVVVSGDCAHQLSHAELLSIITKIINFLCQRHTDLIEYIPEQGVILYATVTTNRTKILELPNRLLSLGQYLFIITMLLGVLLFVYSNLNHSQLVQADVLRQVLTSDGRIIQIFVFSSYNQQDALLHADSLSTQLRLCHHVPWDLINVALSADQHYMSFILTDSSQTIPLVDSVKVNIDNMSTPFITQEWLQKVHICG